MPVTTKPKAKLQYKIMQQLSEEIHSNCFACGNFNDQGLKLKFRIDEDKVISNFEVGYKYQGYDGIVHGGITASILDCAMVHCLFACGIKAVTIEMNVKYRHPVLSDTRTEVRAWLIIHSHGIYQLKAELSQNNQVKALSSGRFFAKQQPKA